ncbi:hypothetical protein AN958_11715 [Leucoagaricus sp. SymC.cos]|nr:hypothetical protein AN958_11715 [Leucoagaricus sp. SymC.cos]
MWWWPRSGHERFELRRGLRGYHVRMARVDKLVSVTIRSSNRCLTSTKIALSRYPVTRFPSVPEGAYSLVGSTMSAVSRRQVEQHPLATESSDARQLTEISVRLESDRGGQGQHYEQLDEKSLPQQQHSQLLERPEVERVRETEGEMEESLEELQRKTDNLLTEMQKVRERLQAQAELYPMTPLYLRVLYATAQDKLLAETGFDSWETLMHSDRPDLPLPAEFIKRMDFWRRARQNHDEGQISYLTKEVRKDLDADIIWVYPDVKQMLEQFFDYTYEERSSSQ